MTRPFTRRTVLQMSVAGLSVAAFMPHAAAADEDATRLLRTAADAMAKVKTFHFDMETIDGKATVLDNLELKRVTGDVVRPDSFRATMTASLAVIEVSVDVVSIGGAVWVTDPTQSGAVWRQVATGGEQGAGAAFTDLINPDRLFLAAIDLLEEPTFEGTEELDGQECSVVTGTFDPARLEELASPVAGESEAVDADSILTGDPVDLTVWIAEDGRVLRIEEEGPLTKSESRDVIRAITFSAFDEPIEISAPE
jgi:hypothetical protein